MRKSRTDVVTVALMQGRHRLALANPVVPIPVPLTREADDSGTIRLGATFTRHRPGGPSGGRGPGLGPAPAPNPRGLNVRGPGPGPGPGAQVGARGGGGGGGVHCRGLSPAADLHVRGLRSSPKSFRSRRSPPTAITVLGRTATEERTTAGATSQCRRPRLCKMWDRRSYR